jgi:NAD(P)-dependent dehydrogenase (short-subunit alcohol dehydrogenase family)
MVALSGRVAIVTGGARGIGRACVRRLLDADVALAVIADRDAARAEATARDLDPSGRRCMSVPTDVTSRTAVDHLVQMTIQAGGRVDILVNAAAITGAPGGMESQSEAVLDEVWAVNVKGTYFTCAAVHGPMVQAGYGRIVNIASIAGKEGNPGLVPYSMTKAAVIGFTKAYAKEVATRGVLVNSIAPAVIETEMLRDVTPEVRQYMIAKIPMGRMGQPEEVAELVLFLSSEAMSFSTGFCFDLSGGRATY